MEEDYRNEGGYTFATPLKPLAVAFRVDSTTDSHVEVSVFAGPDDGHRAHVGHLTLSTAEWEAVNDRNLAEMGMPNVVMLAFDVLKPLGHVLVRGSA